jgi:hypothetical protein
MKGAQSGPVPRDAKRAREVLKELAALRRAHVARFLAVEPTPAGL